MEDTTKGNGIVEQIITAAEELGSEILQELKPQAEQAVVDIAGDLVHGSEGGSLESKVEEVAVDVLESVIENITQWARDRNIIDGSTAKDQFLKIVSEFGELADAISKKDEVNIADGIGDVFVVLTIIAEQCGMKVKDCIDAAYAEIKDRKGIMYNGVFIKSSDARYYTICEEVRQSSSGAAATITPTTDGGNNGNP